MNSDRLGTQRTVLLAEDEETLRTMLTVLLTRDGFNLIVATDGVEALRKSREYTGKIDLLLSDIKMPGISGTELATEIRIERPDTKIVLMSAFPIGMIAWDQAWHFLSKPFMPDALKETLKMVLSGQSRQGVRSGR